MRAWPTIIFTALCLGMVGCDKAPDAAKKARMDQRRQATNDIVKSGPQTTSWETPQGTVIEVTIPKAALGGAFVELKKCTVWRDAVTKTSSLFCDREEIDTGDFSPDLPEHDK